MSASNLEASREVLLPNPDDEEVRGKKLPQYIASLSATLGALAAGMVLGWTASAGEDGKDLESVYQIPISKSEFSWIGSLAALGATFICFPIGILTDIIGRKYSMLLMVVAFSVGWLLIIFSNSVLMFYFGRFITGLTAGAFCVIAPMYSAEIAETEIRGTLGSYFQLLITVGILITYVLGTLVNMRVLSIVSSIFPLIFFGVFVFMPETPTYYLMKGDMESARKSLTRLRGVGYNVDRELQVQQDSLEEASRNSVSFLGAIRSKAVVRGLVIAYGLMFFQQLSGINAVIFYASDIFEEAGSNLKPNDSTIIVGVIQVISVLISSLVVDRLGRRILLMVSSVGMCLTTFALGVYFFLLQIQVDVSAIKWLPLVSVCIFIISFSVGFGTIPWMMMGEIFAPEVKGVAASSACFLNWFMAFMVTKFFSDMNAATGVDSTFWLFSLVSAIGIFFVYFLIPETKGKSLQAIQEELGG